MDNGDLADLIQTELRGVKDEVEGLGREVSRVTGVIEATQESHVEIRGAHERIGRCENDVTRVEGDLSDARVELTDKIGKASSRPAVMGGAASAGGVFGLIELAKALLRDVFSGGGG